MRIQMTSNELTVHDKWTISTFKAEHPELYKLLLVGLSAEVAEMDAEDKETRAYNIAYKEGMDDGLAKGKEGKPLELVYALDRIKELESPSSKVAMIKVSTKVARLIHSVGVEDVYQLHDDGSEGLVEFDVSILDSQVYGIEGLVVKTYPEY